MIASNHSTSTAYAGSSWSRTLSTPTRSARSLLSGTFTAESSQDGTLLVTGSVTHATKRDTRQAIGNYIAEGFRISSSSTGSTISSAPPESSTSLTPSTTPNGTELRLQSESFTYTENQGGSDILGNQTHTQDSPQTAVASTLNTMVGAAPNNSSKGSLISSTTFSTLYTKTNDSDPHRFCETAAPRDPVQRAAIDCYCSMSSWHSSYTSISGKSLAGISWSTGIAILTTISPFLSNISTYYPTNVTPYTLCDGTPRVDVDPITKTTVYNSTRTYESLLLVGTPYLSSQPSCSVAPAGCHYLYYNASLPDTPKDDDAVLAICGLPAHLGEPCLISGGPIRLFYWPDVSEPGGTCNATNSTNLLHAEVDYDGAVQMNRTAATVKTLGTTFTHGTVYMRFETLYASQVGFWDRIGPTFSNYIIPLSSSDISTVCIDALNAETGKVLDFRDLNYPVPASAYSCAGGCGILTTLQSQCTIWDNYNPLLALPTHFMDLAPQWKTCQL